MKKILLMMFASSGLFLAGCSTPSHATKWEYKQVSPRVTDGTLNQLAEEGWSVVCVGNTGTETGNGVLYILRRPKH
jgi:hypothetical protein